MGLHCSFQKGNSLLLHVINITAKGIVAEFIGKDKVLVRIGEINPTSGKKGILIFRVELIFASALHSILHSSNIPTPQKQQISG